MLLIVTFMLPMAGGAFLAKWKAEGTARRRAYIALLLATDLLLLLAERFGGRITLASFADNVTLTFAFDGFGRLFALVAAALYTAVCFYAFEYMEHEERQETFFAFYFISLGALLSVTMAANPVTMYLSFELLTLTTFPLVLHELTKDAVAAGLKYLFYSIGGALMGLLAVIYVYSYAAGDAGFVMGGFLDPAKLTANRGVFLAVIFVGLIGFGTKAGMYPMHGWLPTAHPIAPAPASALLSGIVAKAGVLCIIRLVYFSVGAEILRETWVQTAWMCLALLTVFMGSMMAFRESVMKKRLAYSTISQISYILLGLSCLSAEGLRGGLLHLMQHAASKGCLFLVAGVFIFKLGIRNAKDLRGVGKRMPVTLWCFTIASLSLVGIPPLGGFTSKWALASAALDSGMGALCFAAPVVLLISALLTAGYLLPVTVDGFFPEMLHGEDENAGRKAVTRARTTSAKESAAESGEDAPGGDAEPSRLCTVPMMLLCFAALLVGLFGPQIVAAFGL